MIIIIIKLPGGGGVQFGMYSKLKFGVPKQESFLSQELFFAEHTKLCGGVQKGNNLRRGTIKGWGKI